MGKTLYTPTRLETRCETCGEEIGEALPNGRPNLRMVFGEVDQYGAVKVVHIICPPRAQAVTAKQARPRPKKEKPEQAGQAESFHDQVAADLRGVEAAVRAEAEEIRANREIDPDDPEENYIEVGPS